MSTCACMALGFAGSAAEAGSANVLRELTQRTIDGVDVRDNWIWLMAVLEEDAAAA